MNNIFEHINQRRLQIQANIEKSINPAFDIALKIASEGGTYEDFQKAFGKDLQSKYPDGSWKTINGSHVFVNGGKIVAGSENLKNHFDSVSVQKKEVKEASKIEKEAKLKGITFIKLENEGKTLIYGTKNNTTRLSVEGESKEEIQEMLDFENRILQRAIKEIPEQEEYLRTKMISDVSLAINEALKSNKRIIESTKITIPFLEKQIQNKEIKENQ